LSFAALDDDKSGSTVYPFRVKANRSLFRIEARAARKLCLETFGPGGRMPEPGNRWFGDESTGCYSFKTETDMTLFVVGMSG
jgi:hypothetical protein